MAERPTDRRYSEDHEWVTERDGGVVRIGITAYAAEQLGDIVFVSLPESGQEVTAGEACGELESTKSVSDIVCPVSGVVKELNQGVVDDPQSINTDPYEQGWLFEVETGGSDVLGDLLDADAYEQLIS
ncbi:glycine cleavage system protein GcvH [Microlunatus sp. Y2014]|uniref:glycine cleavage system protein GcvH n=1 Tax=Microlunatus sp. Y2014 TaxID=3418488 RepID=UPI003DA75E93